MKRTASAVWNGGLRGGNGKFSSSSGALKDIPYSFTTRFENEPGTNPEELIGAAHASCFSMALAGQLEAAGMKPESISTTANVTLEKQAEGFAITGIHLQTTARISGGDQQAFQTAANNAKAGCPVSKALASVPITMEAKLEE